MTLSRFNVTPIFIFSLSQLPATKPEPKRASTQQVYDAETLALQRSVVQLQQELLEFNVSAVYRHLQTYDCAVASVFFIRGPDE